MRTLIFVTTLLPLLFAATSAHADNESWFTVGFAFHGVRSSSSDAASPFGGGVNMGWQVRARVLRSIHVQFDYNTTRVDGQGTTEIQNPQSLIREPQKSLTVALDLAHTVLGTPYVLGGVGQGEATSGFSGRVYFGGIGYELPFNSNWAFACEARLLVPPVSDVKSYLARENKKSSESEEFPQITDFYGSRSYQVMIALRYYF